MTKYNMATIKKFEDLDVWKIARELSKRVYILTRNAEFFKDFALKNQIHASSGSAMDNIAEGFGRAGNLEFVNFLSISNGSANEVKSQLYRAIDNNYITKIEFDETYNLAETLNNKLGSFMNYLNTSGVKGEKFKNRTKPQTSTELASSTKLNLKPQTIKQ